MGIEAKRPMKRRGICSCPMTGVWRAVSYVKGVAVIFHGPRACAHIAHRMDTAALFREMARVPGAERKESVPLISSDLGEEEAVFGGAEKLRRAIRYAAQNYRPEVIVIANSCVAGVIGDDSEAAALEMEEELGLPIINIPIYGFIDGEYFDGYLAASRRLADLYMKKTPRKEKTALLVGDCGGPQGVYVNEVKRMLDYFSIKISAQFPSFLTLDEVREAPSASMIIVLGWTVRSERQRQIAELARFIGEKFDIPVIDGVYPAGFDNTLQWLEKLGDVLGMREEAARAIKEEESKFNEALMKYSPQLTGKRVVYCVGTLAPYVHPEPMLDVLHRLGMKLLGVSVLENYMPKDREAVIARVKDATDVKIFSAAESETAMREADLVLTTNELAAPDIRQVYLALISRAGWTGEADLARAMARALARNLGRGGLVYA